jgi:hypothetical protein
MTSHPGRLSAGSKTSTERVRLQQRQDGRNLAEVRRMEKFLMASRYDMSHAWTTGMRII